MKETGNEEGTSPQIEFLDDLGFFSGEVIADLQPQLSPSQIF